MNRIAKKDLWLFASQAAVWILMLLLLPLATFLSTRNWESTSTSLSLVWQLLRAPLVVYFANFYLFGPYLFFRRRYWLFVLCNLLLILGANYGFVYGYFAIKHNVPSMPAKAWRAYTPERSSSTRMLYLDLARLCSSPLKKMAIL